MHIEASWSGLVSLFGIKYCVCNSIYDIVLQGIED